MLLRDEKKTRILLDRKKLRLAQEETIMRKASYRILLNEPRAKRFANFSEQELENLVVERHSEKTKKTTNFLCQPYIFF